MKVYLKLTSFVASLILFALIFSGCKKDNNASQNDLAETVSMTPEQLNMNNFHLVDFVAWNKQLWDMQRHYHDANVKVDMGGQHTEGIEAHIEAMKQTMQQFNNPQVVEHNSNVAQGEWSGVIGNIKAMGFRMATVAKWHNGKIIEEYIFSNELPSVQAATISLPDSTLVNITNSGDPVLAGTVDLQPGWSCIMGVVNGKKRVFFTRRSNGVVAEQYVFDETF